jgi:hypothetical protein
MQKRWKKQMWKCMKFKGKEDGKRMKAADIMRSLTMNPQMNDAQAAAMIMRKSVSKNN